MTPFESFKQNVLKVREIAEEFKGDHKMASKAISFAIDSLPAPFNNLFDIVWNGLEKDDDSLSKLLKILKRIENTDRESFSNISLKVDELMRYSAKADDIEKLSEQIISSNESVISIIDAMIAKELQVATDRIEVNFRKYLSEMQLLYSGLRLVTSRTEFGEGNPNCWKLGYFRDEDIKSGYDARREIIDEVIRSIDNNLGVFIFGKAHYGKTMILKRTMFEQINRGFVVIFGDSININAEQLKQLLLAICNHFPRVLVIVDNVHKSGSEVIFNIYDYFTRRRIPHNNIRFLISAKEEDFVNAKRMLDWEKAAGIDTALETMHKIKIDFSSKDASKFLKKAIEVSQEIRAISRDVSQIFAQNIDGFLKQKTNEKNESYTINRPDPLMLVFAIMSLISGEKSSTNFIIRDINEKINSLGKDKDLWKAALIYSIMNMFGNGVPTAKLASVGIHINHLKSLTAIHFLFKNGEYKVRHERWALEFLVYVYRELFDNDFLSFEAMHKITDILSFVVNNSSTNDLLNVLNRCVPLHEVEPFKPIGKLIIDNFKVPHVLDNREKAKLYGGLGLFYSGIKNYSKSVEAYNQALQLDPNAIDLWNNKGYSLDCLGKHDEALKCYDKAFDLRVHPTDPGLAMLLINKVASLTSLARYKEALHECNNAIDLNPNYVLCWYNKGIILDNLGEYKESIKSLDKALELKPTYSPALRHKGQVLDKLGNYNEAIKCYDKVLDIDPDDIIAWFSKGTTLEKFNEYDKAIECFDKVLLLNPNSAEAWEAKGWNLCKLTKDDEAIKCYDKSLQLNPRNKSAWINKTLSLGILGRHDEAIKCSDYALQTLPNDKEILKNKSSYLMQLERYNEAIICYDKIMELNPHSVESLINKAICLERLGNTDEAIITCDEAIKINLQYPDNIIAYAYNNKAIYLDDLGKHDEALIYYNKALELIPNIVEAWLDRALSLHNEEKYLEAIKWYDKVLGTNNTYHKFALNNKGLALFKLNRYDEAILLYDKALDMYPNEEILWDNKGLCFLNSEKYDEAIKCFDSVLNINPNSTDALHKKSVTLSNKGLSLAKIDKLNEAIELYDKALQIYPCFAIAWHNKAMALLIQGKYDDALKCFDRSLEINDKYRDSYYYKAVTLEKLNRYLEAVKYYNKAQDLA